MLIVILGINVKGDEHTETNVKLVQKPASDHRIRRRKADNHQHNSYHAPVTTSYGSPAAAPVSDVVDLHNEEFCVDVSTYQPVVWVEREGEECKTEFVKQCEDKSENVCADVTETTCEVGEIH